MSDGLPVVAVFKTAFRLFRASMLLSLCRRSASGLGPMVLATVPPTRNMVQVSRHLGPNMLKRAACVAFQQEAEGRHKGTQKQQQPANGKTGAPGFRPGYDDLRASRTRRSHLLECVSGHRTCITAPLSADCQLQHQGEQYAVRCARIACALLPRSRAFHSTRKLAHGDMACIRVCRSH